MADVDHTQHECDNCGSLWLGSELDRVRDLLQRVQPGGVMPSGQCPDCGALCYPVEPDGGDWNPGDVALVRCKVTQVVQHNDGRLVLLTIALPPIGLVESYACIEAKDAERAPQ
jgi:hypothetical protein